MIHRDPKPVFDALRNYLICGFVAYSIYVLSDPCNSEGHIDIFTGLFGLFFVLLLFIWNTFYFLKIHWKESSSLGKLVALLSFPFFMVIAFTVASSELDSRVHAMDIQCKGENMSIELHNKLDNIESLLKDIKYGDELWRYPR